MHNNEEQISTKQLKENIINEIDFSENIIYLALPYELIKVKKMAKGYECKIQTSRWSTHSKGKLNEKQRIIFLEERLGQVLAQIITERKKINETCSSKTVLNKKVKKKVPKNKNVKKRNKKKKLQLE